MESQLEAALLTEGQAHSTWCPETRSVTVYNDAGVTTNEDAMCAASDCMFWRWHDRGERHQSPTQTRTGNLSEGIPAPTLAGHWEVNVGTLDCGDPEWFTDAEQAKIAYFVQAAGEAGEWSDDVPCTFRFRPVSLEPRGYCGKAGHPLQAELLKAQLELLHYQIYDHSHA
ncbi:hypothetical protein [Methylobacterium sp. J-070]|uniref:hypothetical protein n=1 Tax=Methylobacterium sp. J-070 TaxID=2836650 RepID=UPI001FBA8CFD|nr:hypothetical protein [Methylobacterium sp. J-070]MCJ2053559.1 hypothetical protein [Methylobacterium sp. J-070]